MNHCRYSLRSAVTGIIPPDRLVTSAASAGLCVTITTSLSLAIEPGRT
ncbi:hypothetical protein [Paenibacillus apis]|nr:hypothetical protein [Paenibacillus apis]